MQNNQTQSDAVPRPVSHRGYWMFFGGLMGAIVGSIAFLVFLPPHDFAAQEQKNDPGLGFMRPVVYFIYFMGLCMYGLMPGILIGFLGGFWAWYRAKKRHTGSAGIEVK